MASVSSSAVPSDLAVAPAATTRNAAYDRARTFIILLVLIHHSVIPYTYYGHTDRQSFIGFDALVTFNDSFFMAAMFLLSGLFVWPSLQRKGAASFLRGRWWRLGLPFALGAVILMPLAYYAVELRKPAPPGFGAFWWKTVTVGPWESGPIWFLAALLVFDMMAALIYGVAPARLEATGQRLAASLGRPASAFAMFLAASVLVYVPLDLYFGIARWFTVGPLAIQASRVLLYLLYFFAGVAVGSVLGGLPDRDSELARKWPLWLAATIVTYVGLMALIFFKREFLPDPNNPPQWWDAAHAFFFACFSAAQTFNLLALFLRFDSHGYSRLDALRESSFGIFLIHYVPLLWLQYALSDVSLVRISQQTAILKAFIVFVLTLAISWSATIALRRIPGVARVL